MKFSVSALKSFGYPLRPAMSFQTFRKCSTEGPEDGMSIGKVIQKCYFWRFGFSKIYQKPNFSRHSKPYGTHCLRIWLFNFIDPLVVQTFHTFNDDGRDDGRENSTILKISNLLLRSPRCVIQHPYQFGRYSDIVVEPSLINGVIQRFLEALWNMFKTTEGYQTWAKLGGLHFRCPSIAKYPKKTKV